MVVSPSTRAMGHGIQDCPGEEGARSPICISSHASWGRHEQVARCRGAGSTRARAEQAQGRWGAAGALLGPDSHSPPPACQEHCPAFPWRHWLMPLPAAPYPQDKDQGLTTAVFSPFSALPILFSPPKIIFQPKYPFFLPLANHSISSFSSSFTGLRLV